MTARLKPGDSWPCPGCHRSISLGKSLRLVRHHEAGTGRWCPGATFSPVEPSYPQYVKLFGQEHANAIMRAEHPGWNPPTDTRKEPSS